ncbi:MAG: HAD hydrolase-like protein, partial [Rhabdochlamydiaceae bacterium]
MDWTDKFDLFLFDFDGLLVDTEELHFKAYQMLCQGRGYKLPWDINRF